MNLEEARNNIGKEVELDESTKPYTFVIDGMVMYGDIPIRGTLVISDIDEDDGNVGFTNENGTTDWYLPKHLKLKPQNYKIHVPTEAESREAQELFFELGYEWMNSEKYVQHTDIPYLYSYSEEMKIAMGWKEERFDSHKNKQITLQDLRDMVAKKKGIKSIGIDLVSDEDKTVRVMGLFQDFEPSKEMTWEDALCALEDGRKVEFYNELCEQWWDISHLSATEVVRIEKFRIAPKRIYLNGNFTKEQLLQKVGEME